MFSIAITSIIKIVLYCPPVPCRILSRWAMEKESNFRNKIAQAEWLKQ